MDRLRGGLWRIRLFWEHEVLPWLYIYNGLLDHLISKL